MLRCHGYLQGFNSFWSCTGSLNRVVGTTENLQRWSMTLGNKVSGREEWGTTILSLRVTYGRENLTALLALDQTFSSIGKPDNWSPVDQQQFLKAYLWSYQHDQWKILFRASQVVSSHVQTYSDDLIPLPCQIVIRSGSVVEKNTTTTPCMLVKLRVLTWKHELLPICLLHGNQNITLTEQPECLGLPAWSTAAYFADHKSVMVPQWFLILRATGH